METENRKTNLKKQIRGSLLLLLTSAIWGAAFVAQRVGAGSVAPFTFTAVRMLLGGFIMIPVAALVRRKNAPDVPVDARVQRKAGLICGLFLFVATSLQQVSLIYTSAGKAGFLTALYVVLVPVAGWALFRRKAGKMVWLGVALALAALFLLCVPEGGFYLETGDLLLIGCAVCFTGQILAIDQYAPRVNGAALARDEFLVTGILALAVSLFTEPINPEGLREAIVPILYTGIMSSAVGYTLQIVGQRDVNPTLASILMCMESVFALLSGVLLLGESMSFREGTGCALMFIAVILAQAGPLIGTRHAKRE